MLDGLLPKLLDEETSYRCVFLQAHQINSQKIDLHDFGNPLK